MFLGSQKINYSEKNTWFSPVFKYSFILYKKFSYNPYYKNSLLALTIQEDIHYQVYFLGRPNFWEKG